MNHQILLGTKLRERERKRRIKFSRKGKGETMIDRVFERSFPLINFIVTSRGRGGNIKQGKERSGQELDRFGHAFPGAR